VQAGFAEAPGASDDIDGVDGGRADPQPDLADAGIRERALDDGKRLRSPERRDDG
jgi:hypothetical protein